MSLQCPCCGLPVRHANARFLRCPNSGKLYRVGRSRPRVSRWLGVIGILGFGTAMAASFSIRSKPVTIVSQPVIERPSIAPVVAESPRAFVIPLQTFAMEPVQETPEAAPAPRKIEAKAPRIATVPRYQIRYELPQMIDRWTADELETSMQRVPEVSIGNSTAVLVKAGRTPNSPGPMTLAMSRADLAGLPFIAGRDAVLATADAEAMEKYSKQFRVGNVKYKFRDGRTNDEAMYTFLASDTSKTAASCVRQMMACDIPERRRIACELLRTVDSTTATEALVQWAVFDPAADNRAAALDALKARDRSTVIKAVIPFLQYPWLPAVQHACEALVALDATEAVSALRAARREPDPEAAFDIDLPHRQGGKFRRELVRINHAANCILCHPPVEGTKAAPLSAAVPDPNQPLPEANTQEYYSSSRSLVLASTTYLRQDFSMMQPVQNPGPWPRMQRYDYFVRIRRDSGQDSRRSSPDDYRSAYDFALKQLSGPGTIDAMPDPHLAAAAKLVSVQINPDAYQAIRSGTPLQQMLPEELRDAVAGWQYFHGAKATRLALIAYFADSRKDDEHAEDMLAILRSGSLDADLPLKLSRAAR